MQHVVQQWWCEARGASSSRSHLPVSHPAQPTQRSPSSASESAANPPAAPGKTRIRANNATSAALRPPMLKRLDSIP